MIGWKKVVCDDGNQVVIKLEINRHDLKKSDKLGENIACKAMVKRIYDEFGYPTDLKKARSVCQRAFSYRVGKMAIPSNGKEGGIWFWRTMKQAIEYQSTNNFGWYKKEVPNGTKN